MDRISQASRSRNMSKIRSRGNLTTEKRFRAQLVRARISGWQLQSSLLPGRPDFLFPKQRIAVFVDGCFWHGCPRCGHRPKSNRRYWTPKLTHNRERDIKVSREIRTHGWHVLRIWEHEIRMNPSRAISRLQLLIRKSEGQV